MRRHGLRHTKQQSLFLSRFYPQKKKKNNFFSHIRLGLRRGKSGKRSWGGVGRNDGENYAGKSLGNEISNY